MSWAQGSCSEWGQELIRSGASSIAIVDLNQKDADAAAKDLAEWFGASDAMTRWDVAHDSHTRRGSARRDPRRGIRL